MVYDAVMPLLTITSHAVCPAQTIPTYTETYPQYNDKHVTVCRHRFISDRCVKSS